MLPGQVLLQGASILLDSFRRYDLSKPHDGLLRAGEGWVVRGATDPEAYIERPCYYFDGEHINHHGHLTLEVLSRLWALRYLDASNLTFVTSRSNTQNLSIVLKPFGVNPSQILKINGPTYCEDLFIASQSYVLEASVSERAPYVYNKISDFYHKTGTPERIYISRSRWRQQRNLLNELEIERQFEKAGFFVIHPQELPLDHQIELMAGAKIIAGPSGSAMYNVVYSKGRRKIYILVSDRFITANDALVNLMADSCEIIYLAGRSIEGSKPGMLSDWVLDETAVQNVLDDLRDSENANGR